MKSKTYYFTLICILLFPFSSAVGFQATFSPRFSITEEYSDNIFLTPEDERDDFITILSVGLRVQLLGKYSGAEISYDPLYAMYNEYNENDGWRHSGEFSGWIELSKNNRLDARDSFLYTNDPLDAEIDPTIRRGRKYYYINTAGLGLTHQFGEADSINLDYEYRILENEDENIEDNTRHIPSISLTYWFIPRQFGFETNVSYTRAEFEFEPQIDASDNLDSWYGMGRLFKRFSQHFEGFIQYGHRAVHFDGGTEDYQVYNPATGFNYSIEGDMDLSFEIGYYLINLKESDDEYSISANVSLTKTFRRCSINIIGSAGYEGAYFGAENLGLSQFYETGGSAAYRFTRHFSGNIFGSYGNNRYEDRYPVREDKTSRGGFGLTIQPLEWMSIDVNYTYSSVDSTLDRNDYVENTGLIRITLSPPIPLRTSQ